jgi:cell division protein FtsB
VTEHTTHRLMELLRKYRRLVILAVVLFIGYTFIGGSEGFYMQWRLAGTIQSEWNTNTSLRKQIRDEKKRIQLLKYDLNAIEIIARERDGLVRPGEKVYKIVPPRKTKKTGGG